MQYAESGEAEAKELASFFTHFEIKIPPEINPQTAIVTMVTPRSTDVVSFSDPKDKDNKDPKAKLLLGQPISAQLTDQVPGDFIAINIQGVMKDGGHVMGKLIGYSFSEKNGWQPSKGSIAFNVKS